MDDQQFDRIARQAAAPGPRRLVLRGLAGAAVAAALGGLGAREAAAGVGCFKVGRRCRYNSQCCTGNCRIGECR